MNGYHWWYGGWWMWIMMILGILFWVLVIVGLIFLIRWAASQQGVRGGGAQFGESALDIAQKRYAKGEISKEEYAEIVQNIRGPSV